MTVSLPSGRRSTHSSSRTTSPFWVARVRGRSSLFAGAVRVIEGITVEVHAENCGIFRKMLK
jgi:hypothetical protein